MELKRFSFSSPCNLFSHFLTLKKELKLQGCCEIPGSVSQCNSEELGRAGLATLQSGSHSPVPAVLQANVECCSALGMQVVRTLLGERLVVRLKYVAATKEWALLPSHS